MKLYIHPYVYGCFLENSMQTHTPPPCLLPSKSDLTEFSVPKDAQCSEMYAETVFQFFFGQQIFHHKFLGFYVKFSFAPILFKLGSYGTENSKKTKKIVRNFFHKIL